MATTTVTTAPANLVRRTLGTLTLRRAATGRLTFRFASTQQRQLSGLKVNSDRLWQTIHETCEKWGAAHRYGDHYTQSGMARLALSDDDARVRDWFVAEMKSLGCTVTIDQMGNIFARRAGKSRPGAPMIGMGSHLDTQPRGGRYDGILGVLGAVEVMRTIHENNLDTHFDIGVVDWTNEEGARFPKSMSSSAVWADLIPIQSAWNLADIAYPTTTMQTELSRIGYLGSTPCSYTAYPLGAHFELHIEQGPILETSTNKIGVVQGAQAYRWFTITVTGRDAHTGTTPFSARKDPLLAAARMIAKSNDLAQGLGALASTGILKMPDNMSTNTLASVVSFSLDIRHPEDDVVREVERQCKEHFEEIAKQDGKGVQVEWVLDFDSPAVKFHEDCVQSVQKAAESIVGKDKCMPITSGAGHDSVCTSLRCPTAMIFVPCTEGVSHHPEEWCSQEDCAIGAQALLDSVLNYDQLRFEKEA